MYIDMHAFCIDMCKDMCIEMCVDMCAGACVGMRVLCAWTCTDVRIDGRAHEWIGSRTHARMHARTHARTYAACVAMWLGRRLQLERLQSASDLCITGIFRHVHEHVLAEHGQKGCKGWGEGLLTKSSTEAGLEPAAS